jgi:hypothetical protein
LSRTFSFASSPTLAIVVENISISQFSEVFFSPITRGGILKGDDEQARELNDENLSAACSAFLAHRKLETKHEQRKL